MLGATYYSSSTYGQGSGPIAFGYMYCTGNEDSLFECNRNVFSVVSGICNNHYYDVGLKCERKLMLYVIVYHYNILFVLFSLL